MLSKNEFAEYMTNYQKITDRDLGIYDSSDGAIDFLRLDEYSIMLDTYVELISKCLGCDIEELWYFIGECDLGRDPQMVTKNEREYNLDSFEVAYDFLTA